MNSAEITASQASADVDASRQNPPEFVLGPFRIKSEIPLLELRQGSDADLLPVTVTLARVPAAPPGLHRLDEFCLVGEQEYSLAIPGVAHFYVHDGSEITVDLAPDANLADVRGYLLGSCFGALCHQNGMLPLHASAVEHHGKAIAFLGDSGAGKSTMAAFLQQRGRRIISDDICLLEPASALSAPRRVIPVAGWLKLWRESFEHLGEQPREEHRTFSGHDKYRLYLGSDDCARPSLTRLLFLRRAGSPDEMARLEPMSIAQSVAELMTMTYLAYIPQLNGTMSRTFAECASVLAQAPAYRLIVPWGWDRMDEVMALLDKEIFTGES